MKNRQDTDWDKELQEDEKITVEEDGQQIITVLLFGLQRCGREAGLFKSKCYHVFIRTDGEMGGVFQCVYEGEFSDGSQWVGTADCNHMNTDGKFLRFPTAIAESRAEARMLRKALGIRNLSSEEVGFQDGIQKIEAAPDNKIDAQVVRAIEKILEDKKIEKVDAIEATIENKERANNIFQLEDLTSKEGMAIMEWLNEYKEKKPKKLSKKEERALRKKTLQQELAK